MAINTPSAAEELGPLWDQRLKILQEKGMLAERGVRAIQSAVKEVIMAVVTRGSSLGGSGSSGLLSGLLGGSGSNSSSDQSGANSVVASR